MLVGRLKEKLLLNSSDFSVLVPAAGVVFVQLTGIAGLSLENGAVALNKSVSAADS